MGAGALAGLIGIGGALLTVPLIVGSMIGAWRAHQGAPGEAVLQRAFPAYMVVISVVMVVDAANGS